MALLSIVAIIFLLSIDNEAPRVIRYDCSIAEISPDYPIQVKEDCRALNAKRYRESLKRV